MKKKLPEADLVFKLHFKVEMAGIKKSKPREKSSSVTDGVGTGRPCECEQHDTLRNTKKRAHKRESLFSKHIHIRMK